MVTFRFLKLFDQVLGSHFQFTVFFLNFYFRLLKDVHLLVVLPYKVLDYLDFSVGSMRAFIVGVVSRLKLSLSTLVSYSVFI